MHSLANKNLHLKINMYFVLFLSLTCVMQLNIQRAEQWP